MKLLKRISTFAVTAMILASTVTPVMAATTATVDTHSMIIGSEFTDYNVRFKIDTTNDQEFIIEGSDIKFDSTQNSIDGVDVTRTSNTTVIVKVTDLENLEFDVPLSFSITGANPQLSIKGNGGVSSQTISLSEGELSDSAISMSFGDAKNISVDGVGSIADITITENVVGAFDELDVKIELRGTSDLAFNMAEGKSVSLKTSGGLSNVTGKISEVIQIPRQCHNKEEPNLQ